MDNAGNSVNLVSGIICLLAVKISREIPAHGSIDNTGNPANLVTALSVYSKVGFLGLHRRPMLDFICMHNFAAVPQSK